MYGWCLLDVFIDKELMVDVFSFEVGELLIFCWWSVDVLLMLEKSVDILLTAADLQEHRLGTGTPILVLP